MNTHKLKCQHPTQIQLIFNNNSKTTNNHQQTEKKQQQTDKKWKDWPARGQGRWGSWMRARWRGSGRQARGRGGILGRTCVSKQWKRLQSNHIPKWTCTCTDTYVAWWFLKECVILIRVVLPAEALGADSLLSDCTERLTLLAHWQHTCPRT